MFTIEILRKLLIKMKIYSKSGTVFTKWSGKSAK